MTKAELEAELYESLKPAIAKARQLGFDLEAVRFKKRPAHEDGQLATTLGLVGCHLECVTKPDGSQDCRVVC
ncbi:hypothetical protein QO001_005689 [Methylobacterium brachiatum]|uniref:Uncharacterized protein n=1 Tax=Methylobacterium brachiatum TaxID=269660 RepID=A0AAJ1TZZ2_9HYPH|nr:hypothetical protein [Methylobacterium brachiatum]